MSNWQESAYAALRKWAQVSDRVGHVMTLEDIRLTFCGHLEEPNDLREWGHVVRRALSEKIIRQKGWGRAKSSHGAIKARYQGTRWA